MMSKLIIIRFLFIVYNKVNFFLLRYWILKVILKFFDNNIFFFLKRVFVLINLIDRYFMVLCYNKIIFLLLWFIEFKLYLKILWYMILFFFF